MPILFNLVLMASDKQRFCKYTIYLHKILKYYIGVQQVAVFRKILVFTPIVIAIASGACFGQKIVCQVKVSTEKMPQDYQSKLTFLQDELFNYINSFDWTENEFGYNVNCQLEVAFDEVKYSGYEDRYTATIVVSNGIDLQYADKRWMFTLSPGEALQHSSNFHPFTSLVDFYFNLIIAFEYDKLNDLGGTKYLDAAKYINESAKFSTQYYKGWDKRTELLADLMSDGNIPYRKLQFHYFTGYYFYQVQEPENAMPHLNRAVFLLKNIPPEKLSRFYELNYIFFSKALNDLKMTNEAKTLDAYKPEK
jgi:hypothetical protein